MKPLCGVCVLVVASVGLAPSRACAEPTARADRRGSDRPASGWALGVRAGGGGFAGEGHTGQDSSTFAAWAVPLSVELRRTLVPALQVGAYAGAALGADASLWRLGVMGELRFRPRRAVVPWVGLSSGFAAFSVSTQQFAFSPVVTRAYRGVELAVTSGFDVRASDTFAIGPFVGLSGGYLSLLEPTSGGPGRFATATLGLRAEVDLF